MKKRNAVCAEVLVLVLVLVTMAAARDYSDDILRVRGSAELAPVVQAYASHYEALNPGKTVVVIGSETRRGFAAFVIGAADVVMADRSPNEHETEEAVKIGAVLASKVFRNGSLYYDGKAIGLVSDFVAFCAVEAGSREKQRNSIVAGAVAGK